MLALIPIVISSLVVCFVLTPFLRDLFSVLGIVDNPDSGRKAHLRPVPRVGGIALIGGYFIAFITLGFGWWKGWIDPTDPSILLVLKLSPAILLVFFIGLSDDLWGLTPLKKLAGQFVAAGYACWIGVRFAHPVSHPLPDVVIIAITVLWLVLCMNAFNLIDGLDGLATGVALIASASLLLSALIHHNPGLALVITPLIGALLGFLYYNFNPASIFLGDCGSLTIGFLLGCYGLMWNQRAHPGLGMYAPLVALAFPFFEVAVSVMRRFLRNRPIFSSDRNHIHHRIQLLGVSHRDTALVLYGVAAMVAVVAVLQTILEPRFATVILLLLLAATYVGFRTLRYPEFGILGKFLFAGGFRGTLRSNIHLLEYEQSMAAAKTIADCWAVLKNTCQEANFQYVGLRINGELAEHEAQPAATHFRRLRVLLFRSDEVIFGHDPSLVAQAMLIAPLAERLQDKLAWLQAAQVRLETKPIDAPPSVNRAAAG